MAKKRPPLILLVDDDPLIRGLGQELLEHLGYRVETAGDGVRGPGKISEDWSEVDLVVLDYCLPGQNGCQVLKGFKALDARARVLVASGFLSSQEWPASRRRGPWA